MARVVAIIPARLASKRFPRKVLYPIKDKPLIYYVWRAVGRAKRIDRLFVATDSVEIGRAVNAFGGAVIMTSGRPRNGSERAAEAAAELKADLVVNIQADNLALSGSVLDRVIASMLDDRAIEYATLATPIVGRKWRERLYNPNVVKVVEDEHGNAAWFSRYPIPFIREAGNRRRVELYPFLEHIGVYFFRKTALMEYASWRPGRAERAESLEQLRILENGKRIRLYRTRMPSISVDTEDDLRKMKIS